MHNKILVLLHRHTYFSSFDIKSLLPFVATITQTVTLIVLLVLVHKAQASPLQAPLLTEEDGTLTIFDAQGAEHAFLIKANGIQQAMSVNSGALTRLANHEYQWEDANGQQHYFSGSRTINDQCEPLRDESLPASSSENLQTSDDKGYVEPVEAIEITPQEEPTDAPAQEAPDETPEEENEQCNTRDEGEHSFTATPYKGVYTSVDARPQSCQSYFVEYYGTQRGMEIETALRQHAPFSSMQPTLRTFPVIDFMDEQTLYVVHSRDLGSRTFNSQTHPEALLDQLLDDGEQIQTRFTNVLQTQGSISASELGQSTTITLPCVCNTLVKRV